MMNKIESELPKIICHIMRALGGKIIESFMNTGVTEAVDGGMSR